ncbi:Uncharacterized protein NEOC65_000009 [Neochlamydia sp. AcF65]|nr:Uncharacterized protein [Neochlamydia sp. AcF65]NGY94333.1 hypothetical protein [Neochlamydia sp. AcF84]
MNKPFQMSLIKFINFLFSMLVRLLLSTNLFAKKFSRPSIIFLKTLTIKEEGLYHMAF